MEDELRFNLLGKIIYVKKYLFNNSFDIKEFYDINRNEYILDINPMIFDRILQYYSTKILLIPSNIHREYFKEILKKFHIDTSILDRDQRYERRIPRSRRRSFQIIHIIFEYADSCQLAQILHYICSMITLISCALVSFKLLFIDSDMNLLHDRKFFEQQSSKIFIIDIFCLVWAIGEIILRILTSPSLYRYLTTLGFFDLIGLIFHLIYICIISTRNKFSSCRINSVHTTLICSLFYRHTMIIGLLRKFRLVRYIRPLKFFILSICKCKREIIRLVVLLSFLLAFLAPLIYIIESSHLSQCSSSIHCIRTMSDACYYLILIITTVGYGDIYPITSIAHFISMFASLLSLMMISIVLSAIYNQYITIRQVYQMQLTNSENIRYLIDDELEDITVEIKEQLKCLNIHR